MAKALKSYDSGIKLLPAAHGVTVAKVLALAADVSTTEWDESKDHYIIQACGKSKEQWTKHGPGVDPIPTTVAATVCP